MHVLRTSPRLVRLAMAWFVLALGVAIASPMLRPVPSEMVCSTGGAMKWVAPDDDGAGEAAHGTLDCPVCLGISLPLPPVRGAGIVPQALAHALQPAVRAHIAGIAGAPLPPRGPPVLS
ncbi:DUF2946 domain-containing protein [Paracidovorax avenae]|uniref:DUF2946 family protein n=1 Tax=Paracidovorax avenae TaxID=80867 RepID=UPI000D16F5F5|nr:DUF2946 family protein [Paracidovorax avenae]AVT13358.1 DUF2946 domain-containing protein [Paracidovorax avenae]AVT21177.1 DUF2946 domain-containing protein [Paracidovorax avenae]